MITRRRFLAGLGGAVVSLPVLESVRFLGRGRGRAHAEVLDQPPVYTVFVRQGNGCQQADANRGEPERFWPRDLGAVTTESLGTDNADRALSILAPFADRLLLVRGTRFGFSGAGCGHSGGLNQCLTAASLTGTGKDSLATGPSIDWFISTQVNPPGIEPLTVMSGPQQAYIAHGLSYSGPSQLRGAQSNPFAVYQDLVGVTGASQELLEAIARRRTSVNDLVRDEMQELLGASYLSGADRERLETHFAAIRDLEIGMGCLLPDNEVAAIETIGAVAELNENRVAVAEMMMDLIALAFACDATRTATLQIGTGNDQTRYVVDGQLQNTYHRISHRIDSDGSDGEVIPNADLLHHGIDRIYAGMFLHLLQKLDAAPGPRGGTLLDDSVALWTNDLANGPPHSYNNVPQVLAGGGGGFLRTGQYIDAGGVTHNRLLNTIINAAGIRKDGGDYFDSFGDSSLTGGVIEAMIA
ncbi:MAG TPA: DUF1552 domain-containing protein [Kofleriaceae bacterium]|nr:DUF1552 domain-containing protein [Kofleriaceae bacterium]